MRVSQAFLFVSSVASVAVAQSSFRPGDYCNSEAWGCGTVNGAPYVGTCNQNTRTWTIYETCDSNSDCEASPNERPHCVGRGGPPPTPYRPGDSCRAGNWDCGTADGTPYVGMCPPATGTWSVYEWCNNNGMCDSNGGGTPKCVRGRDPSEPYRPGDSCTPGTWACGTTNGQVYVGKCDSYNNIWVVDQYCNNGKQVCYGDPNVRPQCVSVSARSLFSNGTAEASNGTSEA
jgi:hypothetical protein